MATPPPFGVVGDDLTDIDGIGPAISEVLNDAGVMTHSALASMTSQDIEDVLDNAGEQFRFHNPETWPEQARAIVDRQWQSVQNQVTRDHNDSNS